VIVAIFMDEVESYDFEPMVEFVSCIYFALLGIL
jgi:hypothetical protein